MESNNLMERPGNEPRQRILVVGGFHAGSQYAHAINTIKMAQGFARLGHQVGIVCRGPESGGQDEQAGDQGTHASDSPVAAPTQQDQRWNRVYGLDEPLQWMLLPPWVGEKRKFSTLALWQAWRFQPDVIYARHYLLPALTSRLGMRTVAESHAHPSNRSKMFLRMIGATQNPKFCGLVTISEHLSRHYHSLGVPEQKLQVLPDAVDLKLFARPAALPPSPYTTAGPHVVYAGHLYDYKGIPTVLAAAQKLPQCQFHLVGGWPEDVQRQQQRLRDWNLTNVHVHGMQPHADVPRYLWHADALLLPPSANHPSALWTSPVKLGEYLAAEVPVVATQIPALEAWVDQQQVEFAAPDDASSLANAIDRVLTDPQRREQLIENGKQLSRELSYRQRAETILNSLAAA